MQSNSNQTELLKLRGEVGVLRLKKNELEQLVAGMQAAGKEQPGKLMAKEAWSFAGYDTPEAALQTCLWAKASGNEKEWLASQGSSNTVQMLKHYVQGNSEEERAKFLIDNTKDWIGQRILRDIQVSEDTVFIQNELSYLENGKTNSHIAVQELKRIDGAWKLFEEYN